MSAGEDSPSFYFLDTIFTAAYFIFPINFSDFYYMVTEFYKDIPVSGFRVCGKGECDSLGSVRDV